jgi:hypothetical protein
MDPDPEPDPDPYLRLVDPDSQKTSGSGTLQFLPFPDHDLGSKNSNTQLGLSVEPDLD